MQANSRCCRRAADVSGPLRCASAAAARAECSSPAARRSRVHKRLACQHGRLWRSSAVWTHRVESDAIPRGRNTCCADWHASQRQIRSFALPATTLGAVQNFVTGAPAARVVFFCAGEASSSATRHEGVPGSGCSATTTVLPPPLRKPNVKKIHMGFSRSAAKKIGLGGEPQERP